MRFGLFLTFLAVGSCGPKKAYVSHIDGRQINITDTKGEDAKIAAFIQPYHDHIESQMSVVLAFAPATLDKSGQWQTAAGSFFADVTLQKSDSLFVRRYNKHVDFCMLNAGGVRSIIPKGNITAKTAYELMPFENSAIVVPMNDAQLQEMFAYIIADKKPHPLSGISFTIGKDNSAKNILIGGKAYDPGKTYYVVTNDYLYAGGDNMVFFAKGGKPEYLDYKLRDILIDYFKQVQTVVAPVNERISVEN